jgi:hypothetical protein
LTRFLGRADDVIERTFRDASNDSDELASSVKKRTARDWIKQ